MEGIVMAFKPYLISVLTVGVIAATPAPVPSVSESMTVRMVIVSCNRDRTEVPVFFEASSRLGGLLRRRETRIHALTQKIGDRLFETELKTGKEHHYIDVRTSHCATQMAVMSLRGDVQKGSVRLQEGYRGLIDMPDNWYAGCIPVPLALGSVTLVDSQHIIYYTARLNNGCYYLDNLALGHYFLRARLSDGKTVLYRPLNLFETKSQIINISMAAVLGR
jgi:hypothetical protein